MKLKPGTPRDMKILAIWIVTVRAKLRQQATFLENAEAGRGPAGHSSNHFLRMANGMRYSPLVKYVIFEKFRSDPEKDGSEVALAVDTSIHRDPVFGRLFSTFLRFFVKKRFALTRSIFGIL